MSNIYYLFSVNDKFFTDLSLAFQEKNLFNHYYGLAYGRNLRLTNCSLYTNITYISDVINQASATQIDYDFLKSVEQQYQVNLSAMIHADRHLMRFDKEKRLQVVCCLLKIMMEEIDKYKIDIVWAEGIDDFVSFFMHKLCQHKGIQFLFLYQGGIGDGIFFTDRLDAGPVHFEQQLKEKRQLAAKNQIDFSELKAFLENYIKAKGQSTYTTAGDLTYKAFCWYDVKAFVNYLTGYLHDKNSIFYDKHPFALIGSRLKRIVNKRRYQKFLKKTAVKIERLNGLDYFIYPLHFHPECATLTFGRWLNDQKIIIEMISKNLPANVFLVVKEHAHMVGRRHLDFYTTIAHFHNVLFIDNSISPYDLLPASKGVVTISSTMGVEAMLLKKPVISFGERYYHVSKNVYRIRDITKIDETLIAALNHQFDEEDMLTLFSVVLDNTRNVDYFTPTLYDKDCIAKFTFEMERLLSAPTM